MSCIYVCLVDGFVFVSFFIFGFCLLFLIQVCFCLFVVFVF